MKTLSYLGCAVATRMCAALVVLGPVPALAQLEPEKHSGSRLLVKPAELEAERLGRVVKDFARCVYGRRAKAASALLMNSDPVAIDYKRAGTEPGEFVRTFAMEACLGLQANYDEMALGLRFFPVSLRALMAEEDYLARFPKAPALPAGAEETLHRRFVSSAEGLTKAMALGVFADCIVFNDLDGADALVRTIPGTAPEREAARAMAPTLGACLEEGQTISLVPANIRVIVADGLWTRFVGSSAAEAAAVGQ